jgi:hypothetical protein
MTVGCFTPMTDVDRVALRARAGQCPIPRPPSTGTTAPEM